MVPLKISGPVVPPVRIATLCGTPASWLSNWIWNGVSAGAVIEDSLNLMPCAVMFTTTSWPDPAGEPAGEPPGDAPGLPSGDAPGEPPGAAEPDAAGAGVFDGAGA